LLSGKLVKKERWCKNIWGAAASSPKARLFRNPPPPPGVPIPELATPLVALSILALVGFGGFHVLPTEFVLKAYLVAHGVKGRAALYSGSAAKFFLALFLLASLLTSSSAPCVLAGMVRACSRVIPTVARPTQTTQLGVGVLGVVVHMGCT
jgi:hypothetical protein